MVINIKIEVCEFIENFVTLLFFYILLFCSEYDNLKLEKWTGKHEDKGTTVDTVVPFGILIGGLL